jgi:acylphosphatase
MGRVARQAWVSGRVQGVAFRWHAQERATALGVAGWTRNLRDGRVEVWMEGERDAVDALQTWLSRGPPAAHVEDLDVREREPAGLARFEIAR